MQCKYLIFLLSSSALHSHFRFLPVLLEPRLNMTHEHYASFDPSHVFLIRVLDML